MEINLKQGEQKIISFTFKDADGNIISLTNTTMSCVVKNINDATVITKANEDFDKSLANVGIVKITLTEVNLNLNEGKYFLEIRTKFLDNNEVDKTETVTLNILKTYS